MTRLILKQLLLIAIATLVSLTVILKGSIALEIQTIIPNQDNTIIESATGALSNGQGPILFVGRTNQPQDSIRRGVISFDIANEIPKGSKITSVTLQLTLEQTPGGEQSIELHRLLKNWGEGNSFHPGGRGDRSTKGDATWIHSFYDSQFWSNPGGDFSEKVSAVTTVGDEGIYTWESTSEMVADLQQWLDNPDDNFGWLLLGNETVSRTVKGFASSENPELSAQPQLRVTYVEK
ncbi:DNRLRE domain-containing protein [Okeania sp. SIO1F9]|uniref:DNRLRE domain-containing protein n=1 Tax=Okeania sp. SIO1F9 TaxID=2607813 RepID=UPI00257C2CD3|nr:DNRLRE domain-containing protein [Okeania sp. SIO1F9]